jgi:uncharacterized protein YceH (UPF0502 family)
MDKIVHLVKDNEFFKLEGGNAEYSVYSLICDAQRVSNLESKINELENEISSLRSSIDSLANRNY